MWWRYWLVALLSPVWLALVAAGLRALFTRKLELGSFAFVLVIGLAVTGVTAWAAGNDAAFTSSLDGMIVVEEQVERLGYRGRPYDETRLIVRSDGTTTTLDLIFAPDPACRPGARFTKRAFSNLAMCDHAEVDLWGTGVLWSIALGLIAVAAAMMALDRKRSM